MKRNSILTLAVLGAGLLGGTYYYGYAQSPKAYNAILDGLKTEVVQAAYTGTPVNTPPTDFERAAQAAVPSVVHIKTLTKGRQVASRQEQNPFGNDEFFKRFFGDEFGGAPQMQPQQRASGSGVIVSADGYIVANNHVVDGASEVAVTLSDGHKSYKAKVVGTDPSTDLALLKVEANNLPVMPVGNSDEARLGQSVLAIGYPLNLDVTVTQGIISAKSRNIGINSRQSSAPVESFIQTDAAVNPGSSGGALVNTNGELIGINAAIASPTGSYAGYAYAIPSDLMKKVVGDLMKYGSVQRGYLGISYAPAQMSEEQKRELGIEEEVAGIYVMDVDPNGGAGKAGIKKGDAIVAVAGVPTPSAPHMVEQIALAKPGDKLKITVQRGKDQKTVEVVLQGKAAAAVAIAGTAAPTLGLGLANLSGEEAARLSIPGGVKVMDIKEGSIMDQQTDMKKGFVITNMAGRTIKDVEELKAVLGSVKGNLQIAGVYPGSDEVYYYGINGWRK